MLWIFQLEKQPDDLVLVSDATLESAAKEVGYEKERDGCWFVDEDLVKAAMGHDGAKIVLKPHTI